MAGTSLDQIREAADKKYGDFVVDMGGGEEVRLRSGMRLSEDERKAVRNVEKKHRALRLKVEAAQEAAEKGEELPEEDEVSLDSEIIALLREQLRIVATDSNAAKKLLDAVGQDDGLLLTIVEQYAEATELGEA